VLRALMQVKSSAAASLLGRGRAIERKLVEQERQRRAVVSGFVGADLQSAGDRTHPRLHRCDEIREVGNSMTQQRDRIVGCCFALLKPHSWSPTPRTL